MKKKNIKKIIIVLIILIVAFLLIRKITKKDNGETHNSGRDEIAVEEEPIEEEEYVEVLEDGRRKNISTKISEEKKLGIYEIKDINITAEYGQTLIEAKVKNTGANVKDERIDVIFLDKDGKEIDRVEGLISELKTGETKDLIIGYSSDFINYYDVKFVRHQD